MSFRTALLGALTVLLLPAFNAPSAQIESESLGDLNAWGQRYLESGEKEFPTSLWRGSDNQTLLALLQSVRTSKLSPAERRLLRRVVLSPATRPRGAQAEALLAERARLMLELGEARAAAALVPQLQQDARGLDAETLAVDLDLASGQEASACSRLNGPVKDGPYWLKLRAVCAVLQNNFSGAQLAIEVAEAQGINDPWMVEAIFAASGDFPDAPPNARFDSGLNIALSSKAALDTSRVTLAGDRPDLAAAAARRPGVPADLRARFAEIAGELDLISPEDRRQILIKRLDAEGYTPASALEQALRDLRDREVDVAKKTQRLSSVLQTAARSDLTRYRGTARLFLPDLRQLPKTAAAAPHALTFARAAIMAGDGSTAKAWLATLSAEEVAAPDPFDLALLEAIDVLAGAETRRRFLKGIEERLISSVATGRQEDKVASILTYWTGLGIPLSPMGRDFVSQVSDRGERIAQGRMTALQAAVRSGAVGEAALMILSMTDGEPERLAAGDFAILLDVLVEIEAEDVAQDFAIEASLYWKER